jgi:uncharacterized membrane protein
MEGLAPQARVAHEAPDHGASTDSSARGRGYVPTGGRDPAGRPWPEQGGIPEVEWGFAAASFGGALVEFVEAAIIVVAAAGLAGWRQALAGTAVATAILVAAVAVLGLALLHLVPIGALRAVVGALLVLFGVKWLAKATFRLSRPRPAGGHHPPEAASPRMAFVTAFNGVLLEGAEVVFIVLAVGTAGSALRSAILGALAACLLVVLGAVAARGPLAKVPDVVLKYVVGVMLTTFGTFWLSEALGVPWWHGEVSLLWLVLGNLVVSWVAVWTLRRLHHPSSGAVAQGVKA